LGAISPRVFAPDPDGDNSYPIVCYTWLLCHASYDSAKTQVLKGVINYGLGLEMVKAHVEAAGNDAAARWQEMARILSEPTSPADLL